MRRVLCHDHLDMYAISPQICHQSLAFLLAALTGSVMYKDRREAIENAELGVARARRDVRRFDVLLRVRSEERGDEVEAEGAFFEQVVARVQSRHVGLRRVAEVRVRCEPQDRLRRSAGRMDQTGCRRLTHRGPTRAERETSEHGVLQEEQEEKSSAVERETYRKKDKPGRFAQV